MFACEHEDVSPDFLCLAKGVTGGYLPLAATLTTERVYEGFLGALRGVQDVLPRPHFTGNPLACAAALASLEVFEREQVIRRLQAEDRGARRPGWRAGSSRWRRCAEVRRRGFMTGIELTDFPLEARMGHQVDARRPPARRDHPPARATSSCSCRRCRSPRPSCAGWSRSPPKRSPRRQEPPPSARQASHPPGDRQRRPPKPREGAGAQDRPGDRGAGQRARGHAARRASRVRLRAGGIAS